METETNTKNKLSKEEIERYCRQIILPEIGPEGQERINNSKVLVIGAGGLGSPLLMYLAGAGVGTIGIIDGDSVDISNLHRQVIHSACNKGINKAKSAAMLVHSFNPSIKVNTYEEHFTRFNALAIAEAYDLLVDCCDNPATRYLTNDVCCVLNKPLVSGSAVKWEGQLTVYVRSTLDQEKDRLPCYRCLFPLPTPPSAVCNCGDSGVFGPVPGVIGTLQANECIKLLLGCKDKILSKRMLTYDAYEMNFKIFKLRANKEDCISCGKEEFVKITKESLPDFDYEEFTNPKECRIEKRLNLKTESNLNWTNFMEIVQKIKTTTENTSTQSEKGVIENNLTLIDVRPKEQFNMFNLNTLNKFQDFTFVNIPLKTLTNEFETINENLKLKDRTIYITCRAGNLSTHAVNLFLSKGFKEDQVYNLVDGIHGYIKEIDSSNTPYY